MPYCSECGGEVSEEDNYCAKCGASLKEQPKGRLQCISTDCDFRTDSLEELAEHGAKKHNEEAQKLKGYLISALGS